MTDVLDMTTQAIAIVIVVALFAACIVFPTRGAYPYMRRYFQEQVLTHHTAGQWIMEVTRIVLGAGGVSLVVALVLDLISWPMGGFEDPPSVVGVVQGWMYFFVIALIDLLLCTIIYVFKRKREVLQ